MASHLSPFCSCIQVEVLLDFILQRRFPKPRLQNGENEIDLVGEDAVAGRIDFWEIKRDPSRIDLRKLREKASAFFAKHPELRALRPSFRALSLADLRS